MFCIYDRLKNIMKVFCTLVDSNLDSHHDPILSVVSSPAIPSSPHRDSDNISAPRVDNTRVKIIWSPEGIQEYQKLIQPVLPDLRENWLDSSSTSSISVLLQSTNAIAILHIVVMCFNILSEF